LGVGRALNRSVVSRARYGVGAAAAGVCLAFSSIAFAASATQPGTPAAVGGTARDARPTTSAAAEHRAAVTPATAPVPPAVPSAVDGEPIRRRPGAAATPTSRPAGTAAAAPPAFEFRRVVLALGAVIALIFGLRWAAKRVFVTPGSSRTSAAVQVLSRSPLAPKQQVMLLQVGRRIVVVAESAGQMSTLCQIEDPDEVAALVGQIMAERGLASPKAFGSIFGRSRTRFDADMEDPDAIDARPSTDNGAAAAAPGAEDPAVDETRSEIRGLMDKVRRMSSQFRAG
jgi:flagellar biogenesis protein FliO